MKPKPNFTMNSVWDLLAETLADAPKPRPEDSVTVEEFAERSGYSYPQARRKLSALEKVGKLKAVAIKANGKRGICYVAA